MRTYKSALTKGRRKEKSAYTLQIYHCIISRGYIDLIFVMWNLSRGQPVKLLTP